MTDGGDGDIMTKPARAENSPIKAGPALIILLLALAGTLAACDLFSSIGGSPPPGGAQARISIGSAEVPPGGIAKVKLTIDVLTGAKVAEIQVGPSQALLFDPEVIRIKGITGIGEFTVLASDIKEDKGEARFAAVSIYGGVAQGEILEIEVEAVGSAGEESELKLTGVDLLQDETGREIAPIKITNGRVEIK